MLTVVAGMLMVTFLVGMMISASLETQNDAEIRALANNMLLQHRAAHEWVLRNDRLNGDVPARLTGQAVNIGDWRSRVIATGGGEAVLVTWAGANAKQSAQSTLRAVAVIDPKSVASLPNTGAGILANGRVGEVSVSGIALPVSQGSAAIVTRIEENGAG